MRRLPKPALLAVLTLSIALIAAPAMAAKSLEPASSDQPIHVVSDSLEVDNKTQVAVFIGAVKATQGDVTIVSDKLEVFYDRDAADKPKKEEETGGAPGIMDGGGKVRKVVALGHVKITQKDRVAVGRKATYWAGGRKMLLEGKSTVWRGKNQVSGDKITVFLDQDRAVVHGRPGKRVAVTIQPQKQEKK
jgi:lipopolysaccharide export system protein LptA